MTWTASDYAPACARAVALLDLRSIATLHEHGIHAHHCDGYEVLAWPCPTAARALAELEAKP